MENQHTSMNQLRTSKSRSYVVTGGGRGIGRAVVEWLLGEANSVVAIERDPGALTWVDVHPAGSRVISVVGDASDENVVERAADLAQAAGIFCTRLSGDRALRGVSSPEGA